MQLDVCGPAGDAFVALDDVRLEEAQKLVAEGDEAFAVFHEQFRVAADGGRVAAAVFEKVVARFEGFAVAQQFMAVAGVPLCAEEVEVGAPLFGCAHDEFHGLIAEPDDGGAVRQVGGVVGPLFVVDAKVEFAFVPDDAADGILHGEAQAELRRAVAYHFGRLCRAWGVQAHGEAECFEKGGFPLGVVPEDERAPLRHFPGHLGVAAELVEAQLADH